ncbi:hypothetical protein SB748_29280 [Rhizobium sp. SIMBA_035]
MSSRLPPVPDENRSPKGTGSSPEQPANLKSPNDQTDNPDKMAQHGNSKVNATHQGYQQDR